MVPMSEEKHIFHYKSQHGELKQKEGRQTQQGDKTYRYIKNKADSKVLNT